jgi:hypothetical protein
MGLQRQIELQTLQGQTQTGSEALTQSESVLIESAASNSQAASNALAQTSSNITSAISSSATSSAAIDQGIQAAVKTDSDILQAQADMRRLGLKAGLWRAFGLSGALGLVGALAGPSLGTDALHGAAWGAAAGAAGGGVWLVVELWPRRILP